MDDLNINDVGRFRLSWMKNLKDEIEMQPLPLSLLASR